MSTRARVRRTLPTVLTLAVLGSAPTARPDVVLTGVEGNVEDNVIAFLGLDDLDCEADERFVRQAFVAAGRQIAEAVSVYGYYAPAIESSLGQGENCWQATFDITLGDPVLIRSADLVLSGAAESDPEFMSAVANSPLRVGAPVNHAAYERIKRRLSDLARDRGYPLAQFTESRIDVYPEELAADVVLHFESGHRYRFGEIELEQDVLRDDFVQAFIDLEAGAEYDNRALTAAYVSLTDSGYFDRVDVQPLAPDHATETIPVAISLTAAPRRLISYGVGFSTDTGPRLRFGRTIRRWNDRGHQLSFNALLSPLVTEVTANYRMPYGDPRYEWASFDAGIKSEDTDTSESESVEFGARRVFERAGRWSRTQFLNFAVEDFEIGSQVGRSRLLTPGIVWSLTRADNTLRPTRGSKVEFEVRGASDRFGSDTSFVQTVASAKWITSLRSDARIILRGTLGLTDEKDFLALPPSVRFFAGGDNSIRGYKFEALGPQNAAGEVIGGPNLVVASVEYEHPIKPRWSLAVFLDAGNAFADTDLDVKTGAGVGARWQSPLGPVRIDIGVPDDPAYDARLHVSLGPDL